MGEQAESTLVLPPTADALVVPNASLQRIRGQDGVWRLDAGQPAFVPVRLGQRSLDGQVLDGLRAGDRVVVYSQKALAAGARVQIVDALVPSDAAGRAP